MWTIIAGIFLVLHGMIHLLYAGQSGRYFELRPGMVWPDGSWLFSKLLDDESARLLTTILLVLSALTFFAAGFGLSFRQEWWRPTAVGAASFSSLIFILFWDGKFQALDAKGGVGILINLVVLFAVLILQYQP